MNAQGKHSIRIVSSKSWFIIVSVAFAALLLLLASSYLAMKILDSAIRESEIRRSRGLESIIGNGAPTQYPEIDLTMTWPSGWVVHQVIGRRAYFMARDTAGIASLSMNVEPIEDKYSMHELFQADSLVKDKNYKLFGITPSYYGWDTLFAGGAKLLLVYEDNPGRGAYPHPSLELKFFAVTDRFTYSGACTLTRKQESQDESVYLEILRSLRVSRLPVRKKDTVEVI